MPHDGFPMFLLSDEHVEVDEPPPPSPLQEALDYRVRDLCKHLDQAMEGQNVAWALDHTLNSMRNNAVDRKGLRPSIEQRDEMLSAATLARYCIAKHFSDRYDENRVRIGMNALCGLIIHWAETDAQRAARHPDEIRDLVDYAGLLRNDMRNADLLEAIQARAAERHKTGMSALYDAFGAAGVA